MQLSEQELRELVAHASSIDERLAYNLEPDTIPGNDEEREKRWHEWCETVFRSEWGELRRRLEWDQLDEAHVRSLLGAVQWSEHTPLPAWTELLQAVLQIMPTWKPQTVEDLFDPADPLPFEDVLAPFVSVARTCVQSRVGTAYALLSREAHHSLEYDLLKSLVFYAAQALQLEFSVERATQVSTLDLWFAQTRGDESKEVYSAFVARMLRGDIIPFLKEYAVLARQLAVITQFWIDSTSEFLLRLEHDWHELQRMFASGQAFHSVTALEAGLSDPHQGRRSVLALTFDTGHKVIYKPKDLGIEREFQHLLHWLNEHGDTLDFKTLDVLTGDGYGWVEFVEHIPCQSREEAQRYFYRAGMLLCLVYVLEGIDCHRDNLIACGEHPVLVDCEALMQPRQRLDDMVDGILARFLAREQMLHSVLRTGMLPSWQIREDEQKKQQVYDISALGGLKSEEEEIQRLDWEHVNTDSMDLGLRSIKLSIKIKGPILDGKVLQLEDYSEEAIEGFRQMYRMLMNCREQLVASGSPLDVLAEQPARFVYRDTQVYGMLCQKLLAPEYQRSGVRRSIQLERLGRVLIPLASQLENHQKPSSWWPIFAAERQAMQQEDIPYYAIYPKNNMLVVPSGAQMPELFQGASYDLVVERLRSLDEDDMERQVCYVLGSLYSHVARNSDPRRVARSSAMPAVEPERLLERHELVESALKIADQIMRRAIRSKNSATWVAPQFMYRAERYQLQPLNNDLYTGVGGVGLFLSAASKVADSAELRTLALDAVYPLRLAVEKHGEHLAKAMGIGGATGLGSLTYALLKMGQYLDDEQLVHDASRVAALITDERIQADSTYDIFDGCAGAILGLMALYEHTHEAFVVERAEACAQHLLKGVIETESGLRAWVTLLDKVLTGFSHGTAGIAYALLRLYAVTGQEKYREIAQESIAYEDSLFAPEACNWPDLRDDKEPIFMASWCHGAPGIGLARLGGLAGLDTPQIRSDIDAAIQRMSTLPLYDVDYVCCGNMSIVDILLTLGQKLQRPEVIELALQRASQVELRARQAGAYCLDPLMPEQMYDPNFFQGTAGIGYTLLRLASPDTFSSVLLWK